MEICHKHYPEAVCNMARSNLDALPHAGAADAEAEAAPRMASAQEACTAVEDALNFHKAILLRQSTRRGRQPSSGDNKTTSANTTKSSTSDDSTLEAMADLEFDKLDVSIAPKWYPVPHKQFAWEQNTDTFTTIDRMVYKADGVNISDPQVIERADAFEQYVKSGVLKSTGTTNTANSTTEEKTTKKEKSFMQVGTQAAAQSHKSMHKFGEALQKAVSRTRRKNLRTQHQAAHSHTPRLRRGVALSHSFRAARSAHSTVAA